MLNALKNLFGGKSLDAYWEKVDLINAEEAALISLSDDELKQKSLNLKARVQNGIPLEEIIPQAFALTREAAKRTLNQRPYDVQLIGGLVLHEGAVAEMMTGEGKTLTAVGAAYLNALKGEGVHIVTVNEYLARRDAVWMGRVY